MLNQSIARRVILKTKTNNYINNISCRNKQQPTPFYLIKKLGLSMLCQVIILMYVHYRWFSFPMLTFAAHRQLANYVLHSSMLMEQSGEIKE